MKFGHVPTGEALGAILAHSLVLAGQKLAKGRRLDAADLVAIGAAGIEQVVVALLGPGDVDENAAAVRLADAIVPDPAAAGLGLTAPHAGRVNLYATRPGIVEMDVERVERLNLVDPSLTFATLQPLTRVTAGMLVGTIKVIPYAVDGGALGRAMAEGAGAVRIRAVEVASAGLLLTTVGDGPGKLEAKAQKAVETRLATLGIPLADVRIVPHEEEAIAAALAGLDGAMLLILTGAATSDIDDVAPSGVCRAGGTVRRFGMPVDPGNLLFLGALGARTVIGLPTCARSLATNGADFVLERVACGLVPTSADIARMGVGGLLKEIPTRPEPRERGRRNPADHDES